MLEKVIGDNVALFEAGPSTQNVPLPEGTSTILINIEDLGNGVDKALDELSI